MTPRAAWHCSSVQLKRLEGNWQRRPRELPSTWHWALPARSSHTCSRRASYLLPLCLGCSLWLMLLEEVNHIS